MRIVIGSDHAGLRLHAGFRMKEAQAAVLSLTFPYHSVA